MRHGSFTARCKEGSKKTEEQEEVMGDPGPLMYVMLSVPPMLTYVY
jgi:hypothetical protein